MSQGCLFLGNTKNDAWIFVLAILLSCTLVYNSKGTINQQDMDQLQCPQWGSSTRDAPSPSAVAKGFTHLSSSNGCFIWGDQSLLVMPSDQALDPQGSCAPDLRAEGLSPTPAGDSRLLSVPAESPLFPIKC